MESPRSDEDTSAVPEQQQQQQQQQQQDVPPVAEGFVASPEPGDEGATTSPAEPGPEAVFEVAPEDVDTSPGPGAEDPTSVPLDYVPPPEDRGEDVPLDYVPPPEDRGEDVPPDYVPGAEAPTAVPVDDAPEGYIPDYSWLNDPAEPVPEYIAEDVTDPLTGLEAEDPTDIPLDYVPPPEDRGEDVPLDYVPPPEGGGEGVPLDYVGLQEDEPTDLGSPIYQEPTQGTEEDLGQPFGDVDWQATADTLSSAEQHAQERLDSVGEHKVGEYVGEENAKLIMDAQSQIQDTVADAIQDPAQAAEDLSQVLDDVSELTVDDVIAADQWGQERVDSFVEHWGGEYLGEENAKLIMDAESQIQDTVADAIQDPAQAAEDLSQVLDDVSELTVDDLIAADQWGQERVDSFAEHWISDYVGEENAQAIMDARGQVQDIEEQGLDNIIADVDAGNWLQAYDHAQGTVDDVATTYLGVGIGEEAAESVVQGYRDYQDTVSELGAEAVEGVVDTIGDVFDW